MTDSTSSIVILTGAGISAESGLKTFRDGNGLWENHSIEDVASLDGFRRNPRLVMDFYNARRAQLRDPKISPNSAHRALAHLEANWQGDFYLVTQNVDNLHERAGSVNIVHMHGELNKVRCMASEKIYDWQGDLTLEDQCPDCHKQGCLRPHIVWFGEVPFFLESIYDRLAKCDYFVSIGTSGLVYPAAGFVECLPSNAVAIEINLDDSQISPAFQHHLRGQASVVVPNFVKKLLTSSSGLTSVAED